jgi:hypothetical protein
VKRLFFVLQIFLFVAFNFSLLLTSYQLAKKPSSLESKAYNKPVYDYKEEFDPSLQTLNTVDKLIAFCDGLYTEKASNNSSIKRDEIYPDIVSSVIRKRFYHGYSFYGLNNNYIATLLSGVTIEGLNAIVIPDDILKYPYAACSQQSIIMMEVMKLKGFTTRKVGFKGKKYGHFCLEVFYGGAWHFYDPDMEPDIALMDVYGRPDVAFIAKDNELISKLYSKYPPEMVMDLFPNYFYGQPNIFPAPRAIIFHKVSKFLSYTLWFFLLLTFIQVRKKYKQLSNNAAVIARSKVAHPQAQLRIPVPNYSCNTFPLLSDHITPTDFSGKSSIVA